MKDLAYVTRGRPEVKINKTAWLLGQKSKRVYGFRATKQWVEETSYSRRKKATVYSHMRANVKSSSKKEDEIQLKKENLLAAGAKIRSFNFVSPLSTQEDGVLDPEAFALSPLNLNYLDGIRQLSHMTSSLSKPVDICDNIQNSQDLVSKPFKHISNPLAGAGDKTCKQAVPCIKNEDGERKLVWCNPAFSEDLEDISFANDLYPACNTSALLENPIIKDSRKSPYCYSEVVSTSDMAMTYTNLGYENFPQQVEKFKDLSVMTSQELNQSPIFKYGSPPQSRMNNKYDKVVSGGQEATIDVKVSPTELKNIIMETELEADISRGIEEELEKEITYLNKKLAILRVKHETRQTGSTNQPGLSFNYRIVPGFYQPSFLSKTNTTLEIKPRPASECKRRIGTNRATKALQSIPERSRSVQSVYRTSCKYISNHSPCRDHTSMSRHGDSVETSAHPLSKRKALSSKENIDSRRCQSHMTELQMNATMRQSYKPKFSDEEYVKERFGEGNNTKRKRVVQSENAPTAKTLNTSDMGKVNLPSKLYPRSVSVGSTVNSRYFPEFERKIDWVKTLRSETPSTTVPSLLGQLMDHSTSKPVELRRNTHDIHAWLQGNHASAEKEDDISNEMIQTTPIITDSACNAVFDSSHSNFTCSIPLMKTNQEISQQKFKTSVCSITRTPTPNRKNRISAPNRRSRPSSAPIRNIPSAASRRSYSPSLFNRGIIASRDGTSGMKSSDRSTMNNRYVSGSKTVSQNPLRSTSHNFTGSKEGQTSTQTKQVFCKGPTDGKVHHGVPGLKTDIDKSNKNLHCSSKHRNHHSNSAGKVGNKKGHEMNIGQQYMKRREDFEAEYEKFVESSETVEKQVSQLYNAAMEKVTSLNSSSEKSIDQPKNLHPAVSEKLPKHTYIRCIDLIKGKVESPLPVKENSITRETIIIPTERQTLANSFLARRFTQIEASDNGIDREDRSVSSEMLKHLEELNTVDAFELSREAKYFEKLSLRDQSKTDEMQDVDNLMSERKCLPKIIARSKRIQKFCDESLRNSGCVKRSVNQNETHQFSEDRKLQITMEKLENGVTLRDELEGDMESFWCLVGEVKGPIMISRS